jgi:hypothetical protein
VIVTATRSRRILATTFIGIGCDDRQSPQSDGDRHPTLFDQPVDLAADILRPPAGRSYGQSRLAKGLLITPALALKEQGPPFTALSVILTLKQRASRRFPRENPS